MSLFPPSSSLSPSPSIPTDTRDCVGAPAVDTLEQHLSVGTDQPSSNSAEINASPFEKYNPLLHGGVSSKPSRAKGGSKKPKVPEVLTIAFVKKFIQYAKNTVQPVLTPEASEVISKAWTNLRNDDAGPTRKRVNQSLSLLSSLPFLVS